MTRPAQFRRPKSRRPKSRRPKSQGREVLGGLVLGAVALAAAQPSAAQAPVLQAPPAIREDGSLVACLQTSAEFYEVPPGVIWALLEVESGRVGQAVGNTNGSEDLGPMQINTIHLPELAGHYGVSEAAIREKLLVDGCFNIAIGAFILRRCIETTGDLWKGAACYHSRTPKHATRYLSLLRRAVERWYGAGLAAQVPRTPQG